MPSTTVPTGDHVAEVVTPGPIDDLDAHGEPTLIENVQATHGHTVLSPNAIWVRRPRKSSTPLRSPDGIDRCADEEENWRMGGTPSKLRKGEDVTRTPKAKGRGPRGIGSVATVGTVVSDSEKKTCAEPERRSTRQRGRRAGGGGEGGASGCSPSDFDSLGQRVVRKGAANAVDGVERGVWPGAAASGGPEGNVVDGVHQGNQDAKGQPKRRRRKSTKLHSDEFVVDDEEASPVLSREQRATDDDEFVPTGRRVGPKAAKNGMGAEKGAIDTCGVPGIGAMPADPVANANLNQTPTPLMQVTHQQRHVDGNVATQTIRTPSMNLFQHFQDMHTSNSDLGGDIQKVLEENIQAEADMKDIADLVAEISKVNENTQAWEEMLESKIKILEELRMQNGTLKELFAGLGLSKKNLSDFSMKDVESDELRKKKMLSFGRRLVALLRHGKCPKDGAASGPSDGAEVMTIADPRPLVQSAEEATAAKDGRDETYAKNEENSIEGAPTVGDAQNRVEMPAAPVGDKSDLEERFHPIAAQVAGAGLHAAKGDPARAVMYLINKGFQARQTDGFQGDPPPDFCTGGVTRGQTKEKDQAEVPHLDQA